jgi:hypothetical protein
VLAGRDGGTRLRACIPDRDRGCGEHGGAGAHSDADEQGDGEVGERVAAEHRERAQDEYRTEAGVHRTRHRLQQGPVDHLRERHLSCGGGPHLPDPVEDHHGVIDRVPDDGEQRGQEYPVDRFAEPGEDTDEDDHVVRHRNDRGCAERPAKPDREIQQLDG